MEGCKGGSVEGWKGERDESGAIFLFLSEERELHIPGPCTTPDSHPKLHRLLPGT